jgi:hypothetical protein
MPLNAAGLLNVSYAGNVVENGAAYAADAVANKPTREFSVLLELVYLVATSLDMLQFLGTSHNAC